MMASIIFLGLDILGLVLIIKGVTRLVRRMVVSCGYLDRYDEISGWFILGGWTLVFFGICFYLFGLVQ